MPADIASLRRFYDSSPMAVALFDAGDRLVYANPVFQEAYGGGAQSVRPGLTWAQMMRDCHANGRGARILAEDFEAWLRSAASRRGKLAFRSFETDLCDGRWLLMNEQVLDDGAMLCVATDVTHLLRAEGRDLREARDLAQRAALTDELTGAGNRRFILRRLEEAVASFAPERRCAVAIIDIDHFKSINDRLGHANGDAVLRFLAGAALANMRRQDCFGRLGGEEFMLVLPDADASAGAHALRRLLERIGKARPLPDHPDFTFSFSGGVVDLRPGDDAGAAYNRADAALYRAKNAGRGRIVGDESAPASRICA